MQTVRRAARRCLTRAGACGLFVMFLSASARPASAAPPPLAVFLSVLHALGGPPDAPALLQSALQDPGTFRGHVFEASVTVNGTMGCGGQVTALLSSGPLGSVSVRVPAGLADSPWFSDTGARVRVLVRLDHPDDDPALSLVAAAPEGDVAQAEGTEAMREQTARLRASNFETRLTRPLASRTRAYERETPDPLLGTVTPGDALSPDALRVLPAYRDAIRRLNPRLPGPLVDTITANILGFSQRYGVDPRLVIAMMIAESGFDIYSTSRTGAMGLGQLMPETARGLGVTDAYDPVQNIAASVRLLRGHLDQYGGQLSLTMAAYNAGPGAVRRYHGVPPFRETQRYVAKVTSLYQQLCGG